MTKTSILLSLATCVMLALSPSGSRADVPTPEPYRAFERLIGKWDTGAPRAPAAMVQRFSWGPGRSYIWYRTSTLGQDGGEHLHFEGPMVWNAATGALDFLFVVEPGSLAQEQGEVRAHPDGSIVREVVLTSSSGTRGEFRQIFRFTDGGATTSLMRRTASGWEPTFPGSDDLRMTLRDS